MNIFLDTEFIENGHTIELVSIGMVREDGSELYMESSTVDLQTGCDWFQDNVRPHLVGREAQASNAEIRRAVLDFTGTDPRFIAYYADYDWVVLCQLYGRMVDLPKGWPMMAWDIRQTMLELQAEEDEMPPQPAAQHNALEDARWVRDCWTRLREIAAVSQMVLP